MTMDVSHHRKIELKSEQVLNCGEQTQVTPTSLGKATKRPFDVAFLMLPDDKLKQKKLVENYEKELEVFNNNKKEESDDEDEELEVGNEEPLPLKRDYNKLSKYFTQKQQIFGDPTPIKAKNLDELRGKSHISPNEQKSAFTKVNLMPKHALRTVSPSSNLSLSPDLSYQNSLSPSPPSNRHYQHFPGTNFLFKNQQQMNAYQANLMQENFTSASAHMENHFLMKSSPHHELLPGNFSKMRPQMYRPELPYNYSPFPNQDLLKMASPPDLKFAQEMRNPAAAILSTLLPPSLAALSLPAQNVCAKCNISFRMTSDLVYHMRSHHKNDTVDLNKKRREDKLKCPVCAESFRERHHLTRHMTAHQDKEEDGIIKKKEF